MNSEFRGSKGNNPSRAFQKLLTDAAGNIARIDSNLERWADEDIILKGISIKSALYTDTGEWLMTIRAVTEGKHVVAFHAASSLLELMNGFANRWNNKSLKWRDDEYAG